MSVTLGHNYEFDNSLGTPSSQKILRFLSVWNVLSFQTLRELTSISESQLHNSLKSLLSLNVISRKSRGIYSFSDNEFAIKIKSAYYSLAISLVNYKINEIETFLDDGRINQARDLFRKVDQEYSPLLSTHFDFVMDSLVHQFLDLNQ